MLKELASAGDLPLPAQISDTSNKRERDSDSPASSAEYQTTGKDPSYALQTRPVAGSRRVQSVRQSMNYTADSESIGAADFLAKQPLFAESQQPSSDLFALPVHSGDLGRLPLTGDTNISTASMVSSNNMRFNTSFQHPPQVSSSHISQHSSSASTPPIAWRAPAASDAPCDMTATFPMDQLFYNQVSTSLNGAPGETSYSSQNFAGSQMQAAMPAQTTDQGHSSTATVDDVNAMWSEAPANFQYVVCFRVHVVRLALTNSRKT